MSNGAPGGAQMLWMDVVEDEAARRLSAMPVLTRAALGPKL
jgi:hypothetical protein